MRIHYLWSKKNPYIDADQSPHKQCAQEDKKFMQKSNRSKTVKYNR